MPEDLSKAAVVQELKKLSVELIARMEQQRDDFARNSISSSELEAEQLGTFEETLIFRMSDLKTQLRKLGATGGK